MKNPDSPEPVPSLSPVSRRAFLLSTPPAVVAGAAALTGCGTSGQECLYCDGPGQDYQVCDGTTYCDYYDYADNPVV